MKGCPQSWCRMPEMSVSGEAMAAANSILLILLSASRAILRKFSSAMEKVSPWNLMGNVAVPGSAVIGGFLLFAGLRTQLFRIVPQRHSTQSGDGERDSHPE